MFICFSEPCHEKPSFICSMPLCLSCAAFRLLPFKLFLEFWSLVIPHYTGSQLWQRQPWDRKWYQSTLKTWMNFRLAKSLKKCQFRSKRVEIYTVPYRLWSWPRKPPLSCQAGQRSIFSGTWHLAPWFSLVTFQAFERCLAFSSQAFELSSLHKRC